MSCGNQLTDFSIQEQTSTRFAEDDEEAFRCKICRAWIVVHPSTDEAVCINCESTLIFSQCTNCGRRSTLPKQVLSSSTRKIICLDCNLIQDIQRRRAGSPGEDENLLIRRDIPFFNATKLLDKRVQEYVNSYVNTSQEVFSVSLGRSLAAKKSKNSKELSTHLLFHLSNSILLICIPPADSYNVEMQVFNVPFAKIDDITFEVNQEIIKLHIQSKEFEEKLTKKEEKIFAPLGDLYCHVSMSESYSLAFSNLITHYKSPPLPNSPRTHIAKNSPTENSHRMNLSTENLSISRELQNLSELFKDGLLTSEEFAKAKDKLI
jgi:hypothetical protein